MKIKQLIEKLSKFDPNLEVEITDGYEYVVYSTKNISIKEFHGEEGNKTVVDIGIGGNRIYPKH
jgi:hypothetical protein